MKAIRLFLIGLLAVPSVALAQANTAAPKREPHPVMVAFLTEIEGGDLEKAAKRIASVNDMFGRQRAYQYFTQAELVALLANCKVAEHTSLKSAVAIEKMIWGCPGGDQYSMIFNHVGEDANPYLYVGQIETVSAKKAREEENRKLFAKGPPPPIAIRPVVKSETSAEYEERKRLETEEKVRKRELVGEAVLSGDLDKLAEFTDDATDVAYITHDRYFDVKIKHVNGFGMADARAVFERAFRELGKPISVRCFRPEGKWAPERCEWQLEDPKNFLYAEMNFAGEGGSMNSIRVYRSTPQERLELREQAIELGVIEG